MVNFIIKINNYNIGLIWLFLAVKVAKVVYDPDLYGPPPH